MQQNFNKFALVLYHLVFYSPEVIYVSTHFIYTMQEGTTNKFTFNVNMKQHQLSSRNIVIALHLIFWGTLLLFPFFFSVPGKPFSTIGHLPLPFYLISLLICALLFYGNAFFLYPKLCNKRWWWGYLFVLAFIFALVQQLKIIILTHWFPDISIFGANAPFIFAPTLFALAAGTIYRYTTNHNKTERIRQEKEAEQLAAELKFLRSQISPHFLFNVLTNLVSLARKKSDRLEPALIMLADLMRYMLYDADVKKVTLGQEVQYLKNYIALQQLRFGDDVTIETNFELQPGADEYKIEPMLLIPFVENAFKHGVGWINDPKINIGIKARDLLVSFKVENKFNMADQVHKDKDSGIGLANLRSRLQLLYPDKHQLLLENENNIFKTQLTLQL